MSNVCVTLLHPSNVFILNSEYYNVDYEHGTEILIQLEPIKKDIYLDILLINYTQFDKTKRIFISKNLLNSNQWIFCQRYQEMDIYHIIENRFFIKITFEIYVLKGYVLLRKIYLENFHLGLVSYLK